MGKKVEELKNLPARERIKRLKELAEDDRKEIEEAQKMLKDSEEEANEEAEMLRKVPIPQIKAVDIDSLFSEEEKDAFATMRFVPRKKEEAKKQEEPASRANLEQIAEEKFHVTKAEFEKNVQYLHALDTVELQHKREELYSEKASEGYTDNRRQMELYNIRHEMDQRRRDAEEGRYSTSEEVLEILGLHVDKSTKIHYKS